MGTNLLYGYLLVNLLIIFLLYYCKNKGKNNIINYNNILRYFFKIQGLYQTLTLKIVFFKNNLLILCHN